MEQQKTLRKTNQEPKREVCNNRERNSNSRELHISNMPNKDISKGVSPIIAQNIESNWTCNCPQLCRLLTAYSLGLIEIIHRHIVPLIWTKSCGRSMVEVHSFKLRIFIKQRWIHLNLHLPTPRCRLCRGRSSGLLCFLLPILFMACNLYNLGWSSCVDALLLILLDWSNVQKFQRFFFLFSFVFWECFICFGNSLWYFAME